MKSVAVMLILLLSGISFAHAKTEMTLFVSNHLGFRKQDRVTVESPQKIFYNDIQIPKKLVPKIQKQLTTLRKMPKEKRQFCYENQYFYTLIEGDKKQEVHGCAQGKEFARVAMAFSNIQQVILKNEK
jgi:hypothetical protein